MNSGRPAYLAYVIAETKPDQTGEAKSIWRECGSVWPHKNGQGFDLVIHPQMAISGRVVLMPPREHQSRDGDRDRR